MEDNYFMISCWFLYNNVNQPYICMYVCMYVCVCIYIYIYTHSWASLTPLSTPPLKSAQNTSLSSLCYTAMSHCECVSHCCVRLFVTPWIVVCQSPLSMEFSRQEYWSGLPFPSPGDLPDSGIKPRTPELQTDSLPSEPNGSPICSQFFAIWAQGSPICSTSYLL